MGTFVAGDDRVNEMPGLLTMHICKLFNSYLGALLKIMLPLRTVNALNSVSIKVKYSKSTLT